MSQHLRKPRVIPILSWWTLLGGTLLFMAPFFWTLSTALKSPEEISRSNLIPTVKVRDRILEIREWFTNEDGQKVRSLEKGLGETIARSRGMMSLECREAVDSFEALLMNELSGNGSMDSGKMAGEADQLLRHLNGEIDSLGIIPSKPQWRNFREAWTIQPFTLFFYNTFLITFLSVLGGLLSSSMVGYGFACFRFPGRNLLFMIMLGTMMIPSQVTMIPIFAFWSELGFVDTFFPMVLPSFFGSAFMIFFMRQYFLSLPRELMEAAEVDGASPWQTFWQVMLPQAKPALVTLGLLSFFSHWDDFMGPLLYLNTQEHYTVSFGLRLFQDQYSGTKMHLLMAAALIHLAPCIVLFVACQRYFVRSIVLSGIKG